jgi:hypothetical protein
MPPRTANVGASGARRRRLGGAVWLVLSVVAVAALLATHRARSYRLLLVVPFGLAALGFLQAREKT